MTLETIQSYTAKALFLGASLVIFFGVVAFANAQVPDGCSISSPGINRNCTEYFWNPVYPLLGAVTCRNNNATPADSSFSLFSRTGVKTTVSKWIRDEIPSPGVGWGSKCAEDCPDPTGCGSCECKCQGTGLICADQYHNASNVFTVDTCRVATGYSLCMPSATITSPTPSGSVSFLKGATITFNGTASDPLGDNIVEYRWIVRKTSDPSTDILTNSNISFTSNSLAPDNYVAYFSAKNQPGNWATPWKSTYFSVTEPAPTLNLTANPTTATVGQTTTLKWSSSNVVANSCVASGDWSGSGKPASNTTGQVVTLNTAKNYTFTLTCTGTNGSSIAKSASVSVTALPAPTLDLTANPTTATVGQTTTLKWSSSNVVANSCAASGDWSGSGKPASGDQTVTLSTAKNYTFTLTCTGTNGSSIAKSASVSVTYPTLSVTLTAHTGGCTSSPAVTTAEVTDTITWCANAGGGSGIYNHPFTWTGVTGSATQYLSGSGEYLTKRYGSVGSYTTTVQVTDSAGQTASDSETIQIQDNRVPQ